MQPSGSAGHSATSSCKLTQATELGEAKLAARLFRIGRILVAFAFGGRCELQKNNMICVFCECLEPDVLMISEAQRAVGADLLWAGAVLKEKLGSL